MTTSSDVVGIAVSQLGVVESPARSNRQPYGAALGLNGVAWCAIFQWWVFLHAGVDLRQALELGSGPMSYCPSVAAAFKAKGWWYTWPDAKPGDLVFYSWSGRVIEHVGLVEGFPQAGFLSSIEGNTAFGNDANGGQVMRRLRDNNVTVGFGRFPFSEPVEDEDDMYMIRTPDGEIDLVIGKAVIHLDGPGAAYYTSLGVKLYPVRQQDGNYARSHQ